MSDQDLVTIATYGNSQDASIAKAALEAEDLRAYLVGAEAGVTLWHVGTALGGVRVQVDQSDADRAINILESSGRSPSIPAWNCANCGAEVDAGFGICWSCGTSADQQAAVSDHDSHSAVVPQATAEPAAEESVEDDVLSIPTADDTVNRAWRAAVIGLGFFPLAFYAFILVMRASGSDLSAAATRKFYGTLALIVLAFAFLWGLFTLVG